MHIACIYIYTERILGFAGKEEKKGGGGGRGGKKGWVVCMYRMYSVVVLSWWCK